MEPIVVNRYKSDYDIYIGRGTKWGNPFKSSNRDKNIEDYRLYLWEQIKSGKITKTDFDELDGKVIACSCKPKPCHGDVIVAAWRWINGK